MKNLFLSLLALLVLNGAVMAQLPWPDESPNPDAYGYIWKTNDNATGPSYNWIDITTTGTEITGLADDGNAGPVEMGIVFPYYWEKKSKIYVGANGFVSFDGESIGSGTIGFPKTPDPGKPNNVLALYMADLNPAGAGNPGQVFYYSDAANSRFIISYINMPYWTNNAQGFSGSNTFQVILDASDSTITYQYKDMQGDWNPSYNGTTFPFVTGMENNSGTIGLFAPDKSATTTADKPVNSTAITFYAPANPLIEIPDFAVRWAQNKDNGGSFVPWTPVGGGGEMVLQALVASDGNADITVGLKVKAQIQDSTGAVVWEYIDETSLPTGLDQGETMMLQFPQTFEPAAEGKYSFIVSLDNPFDIPDIIGSNNAMTVEISALDTAGGNIHRLDYVSDDYFNVIDTAQNQFVRLINWSGAGGAGKLFRPMSYPVMIKALEFAVYAGSAPALYEGFTYQIFQASSPDYTNVGPLLQMVNVDKADVTLFDPATLPIEWTRVEINPAIQIDEGGFMIGWIQRDTLMSLLGEESGPISRRTYEILGLTPSDWAEFRDNQSADVYIRAEVEFNKATVSIEDDLAYLKEYKIYPNPTVDRFQVEASFEQARPVQLRIYNTQGMKVYLRNFRSTDMLQESIDLSAYGSGVYMVQLVTPEGTQVRRVVVQ